MLVVYSAGTTRAELNERLIPVARVACGVLEAQKARTLGT